MENRLKLLRVLIVDDDKLMRKLIGDILVKLGFTNIYKASNGNEALSTLDSTPIDFVISDWRMEGGMDGIEFVRNVRGALKEYAFIPIIMLTGNAELHHVTQARDVGASEYLIKPFTVKALCDRLKEIIDHPREFVVTPTYVGPTRRRQILPSIATERRKRRVKPVTRQTAHDRLGHAYI